MSRKGPRASQRSIAIHYNFTKKTICLCMQHGHTHPRARTHAHTHKHTPTHSHTHTPILQLQPTELLHRAQAPRAKYPRPLWGEGPRVILSSFDLKPQPPRPELAGGDVDPPPPVGGAERDANFSTQYAIFHVIACIFCKL